MSGSSLDGLDIALVRFQEQDDKYHFQILQAETLPYPEHWTEQLSEAFHKQPEDLVQLDKDYGKYLGEQVLAFAKKHNVNPDFVASHGHTIFHRPEEHYTLQIGDGQELAKACGFTVINDFLCIANQALNYLANMNGFDYDRDGELARSGKVDITLLKQLNKHPFYGQLPPKSLGREFFETYQKELLKDLPVPDMLATFVEHIALQIALPISFLPKGKLLCTGGGARNKFLIERLQARTKHEVVMPEKQIIDYKEALVFAFLGLLRLEGKTNVLASVTGAESDSSSGRIWKNN